MFSLTKSTDQREYQPYGVSTLEHIYSKWNWPRIHCCSNIRLSSSFKIYNVFAMRSRMWRWRSSPLAVLSLPDVWEHRKFLLRGNSSSMANALGQISVRCFMNVPAAAARRSHSFAFTMWCVICPFFFAIRNAIRPFHHRHQRQPINATATSNLFKRREL